MRQEAKAERAEQEAKAEKKLHEMQTQMEKLRVDLTPRAAVSAEQLRDLQSRLDTIHAAQLLTDAELYTLEDTIAVRSHRSLDPWCLRLESKSEQSPHCRQDYVELQSELGAVITAEALKVHKLVQLSGAMPSDARFARQARRKHC